MSHAATSQAPAVVVTSASFNADEVLVRELTGLGVRHVPWVKGRDGDIPDFLNAVGAAGLIVGLEPFGRDVIARCRTLRYVAKYGVGKDNVDEAALAEAGIGFGWTAGVNRRSVSELALAFMLGHCRNVAPSIARMREGTWVKDGGRQLSDRVVGLVGFGNVGTDLAALLRPFGCRVRAVDVVDRSAEAKAVGVELVDYDTIVRECDVISFHVPSTPHTRGMFGAREIALARDDLLVVNTARGDVVDFQAVVSALAQRRVGGYATDVFPEEPFDCSELAGLTTFYGTPHIGGNAREAVRAMGLSAVAHVRSFIESGDKGRV